MIDATNCPDGVYGPAIIPVNVRVRDGKVVEIAPADSHDFVLTARGATFDVQERLRPVKP